MSRSTLGKLALSLMSLVVLFFVLEIGIRVFVGDVRGFSQPDDLLGWSYLPGASYRFAAPEGCPGWITEGKINSYGLRDREFELEKPDGVYRILALGDSQTEGFQVPLEQTWPKVLETHLNARNDGIEYEVINAGRSGMGTTLEYLYFRERGYRFQPDLVVTLFHLNDFEDNSSELAISTSFSPYYDLVDDELQLDTAFLERPDYKLRKRLMPFKRASGLASLVLKSVRELRAHRAHAKAQEDRAEATSASESQTPDEYWVAQPEPRWQRSIEITQRMVQELADEVERRGAKFVLVSSTAPIQVHADDREETQAQYPHWDLDVPQQHIAAATREAGIPFLNLLPQFLRASREEQARLHGCEQNGWKGHWNAEAHRRAATALAESLETWGTLTE